MAVIIMSKDESLDEIKVKIIEDKSVIDFSFLKQLALLTLGSLIFLGIIEGYKSDLGKDKGLVKEFYRPAKNSFTSCSPIHNSLFLKYGELAGSYQLLFNELEHILENPNIVNKRDYQVWPMAVLKTNGELKTEIKALEDSVDKCRVKTYSHYEELALVTGTLHEYDELAKTHFDIINKYRKELKESLPTEFKDMEPQNLVVMMREITTLDFSDKTERESIFAKMEDLSAPLIKNETNKMNYEQKIFEENQKFHLSLRELFLTEINRRNTQSFLSWLF